jgi:hypothetical protein
MKCCKLGVVLQDSIFNGREHDHMVEDLVVVLTRRMWIRLRVMCRAMGRRHVPCLR